MLVPCLDDEVFRSRDVVRVTAQCCCHFMHLAETLVGVGLTSRLLMLGVSAYVVVAAVGRMGDDTDLDAGPIG